MLFESVMFPNSEWRASAKGGGGSSHDSGSQEGRLCQPRLPPGAPHRLGGSGPLRPLGQKWPPGCGAGQEWRGLWQPGGRRLTPAVFRSPPPATSTTDTSWAKEQQFFFRVAEQREAQWGTDDRREHVEPCLSAGLCEAGFWVLEETGVKSSSSIIWALRVKTQFSP